MQLTRILKAFLFFVLVIFTLFCHAQTNSHHVKVNGYYRKDGTYVQPYFRTAPNSTKADNFSTKGNVNPYTGKPGWIKPNNSYNTFYYSTYTYNPKVNANNDEINTSLPLKYKNRTYIQDEHNTYSCYLTVFDERTFNVFDMNDNLILYLVINHRGDWRIFDNNWIYIKTIFVTTE
ncbi:MAG: hypothetical protein IPN61_18060 [Bacteroidetes bacterium]|nr:hypothetical protein [Bacteroidota bacterium]